MTRRIILDCDPGHDDAMAILLAHGTPEVSLAAITTVAGNHPLELTTLNALRVCSLAGIRDVPVAAGCAAPLARPLLTAPEIHGTTGTPAWAATIFVSRLFIPTADAGTPLPTNAQPPSSSSP